MSTANQTTKPHNILDTDAKRRLRQRIDEILTPELIDECPGLAIMVVSVDEYEVIMEALRNEANRKRQQKRRPLILNILRNEVSPVKQV